MMINVVESVTPNIISHLFSLEFEGSVPRSFDRYVDVSVIGDRS